MRIISGSRRGLILNSPKGANTRPTEDRLKENLFNLLGPIPHHSKGLDCFAGTGALGLEFISRCDGYGLFFEKDPKAFETLIKNVQKCKFEEQCDVYCQNVLKGLNKLDDVRFDYIFIDPPYQNKDLYNNIVILIAKKDLLNLDGKVIIERSNLHPIECPSYFDKWKIRKYRDTIVEIWDKRGL